MPNQNPLLPAIAPSSGGALTTTTGPQRIATRMAENLLTQARSQERGLVAQRRYQIGDYEFREADHAQIQRWARRLGMAPEAVVEGLANSQKKRMWFDDADFRVKDGTIVSLVWDFDLFPLTNWDWGAGLGIARLGILNAPNEQLPTLPKCLRELLCDENELTSLSLEHVPGLQHLSCSDNDLTELDLTPVPGLQKLNCNSNQLTELDLTPVPNLRTLDYSFNAPLTKLDLTPVPGLQRLDCSWNYLTELPDLTPVPDLQTLDCHVSQLTELNLTPVPGLQNLYCYHNQLTELDLTPMPGLQKLDCSTNQLTELDLTHVPGLQELNCDWNQLTELDLTPVPRLKFLCCDRSVYVKGAPKNLRIERQ